MFFHNKKDNPAKKKIRNYLRSNSFQRVLIGMLTVFAAFVIVENGAAPERYKLKLSEISKYNIAATREIENRIKTDQNAKAAADEIKPVMKEIAGASVDVIKAANEFFTLIESARAGVEKRLEDQGLSRKSKNYKELLANEQAAAADKLKQEILVKNITLSSEQVMFLISKASDDDIANFKAVTNDLISSILKEPITEENLAGYIITVQNNYQSSELNQDMKNIGDVLVKAILRPNKSIDFELTEEKKEEARRDPKNTEMVQKGKTILNIGDLVTTEKYELLKELNLLEESRFDFMFAAGIFILLLLLALLLILYMNHFCRKILYSIKDLLLLSVIIIMTLLISRGVYELSTLAVPIFLAVMLISILLEMKLAIMVNFILTISVS